MAFYLAVFRNAILSTNSCKLANKKTDTRTTQKE